MAASRRGSCSTTMGAAGRCVRGYVVVTALAGGGRGGRGGGCGGGSGNSGVGGKGGGSSG